MTKQQHKNKPADLLTEAGEGAVTAGGPGERQWLEHDVSGEMLTQMRLRESGIPPRYMNKTLENFTAGNKDLRAVKAYAENYIKTFIAGESQKGLFIYGCAGCGKSHIASAILKEIIAAGHSGFWCNMPELMTQIRDVISRNAGPEQLEYLQQRCNNAQLLVFDDLGAEAPRGVAMERLYAIVNRRYELSKPIIVTSNLQLDELADQYRELGRIVSRLGEMCTRFTPFPNVDYRLKHFK
ncbi:ATP-binding protein [Candidatus Sumerlaeota bacterium]|nr:ATP-binding protein [Candidatus Sumerlaeota bacterium]